MAGVKRNLLDWENGFNIAVNAYIIRYMYSHMEDKAKVFMVEGSERRKSVDIYRVVGLNRQKISRMGKGQRFEMSQRDRETIVGKLGIEDEYFRAEGKYIELRAVNENDWKCYFESIYDVEARRGLRARGTEKEREESVKKVREALEEASREDIVHKEYGTNTAVYRIYYYFKNGAMYRQETRLTTFLKSLYNLQMTDWDAIEHDLNKMEKYSKKLGEHYKYLSVLLNYRRLKQGNKEK